MWKKEERGGGGEEDIDRKIPVLKHFFLLFPVFNLKTFILFKYSLFFVSFTWKTLIKDVMFQKISKLSNDIKYVFISDKKISGSKFKSS